MITTDLIFILLSPVLMFFPFLSQFTLLILDFLHIFLIFHSFSFLVASLLPDFLFSFPSLPTFYDLFKLLIYEY